MTAVRWIAIRVLFLHGLIHFLGAAKGLGLADIEELSQPVGPIAGVGWTVAGLLVIAAAATIARGSPTWWWAVAAGAAVLSQIMIVSDWTDAKVGTIPNLILLVAAALGFAMSGPTSLYTRHRKRSAQLLDRLPAPGGPTPDGTASEGTANEGATPGDIVTEKDLDHLPRQIAEYVGRSGAVGKPVVHGFRADVSGRIRSGSDDAWMPFTGEQITTFGDHPGRAFYIRATRAGVPVVVFHDYDDGTATMRGRAAGLVPVLDAEGPELDRSETVTVFNDLTLFAPATLVHAPVRWTVLDDRKVHAEYTAGGHTVTAELVFNDDGDLVDFISHDRYRASDDGKSFDLIPWNTELGPYRQHQGRRICTGGTGFWHDPAGAFAYVEFTVDGVTPVYRR